MSGGGPTNIDLAQENESFADELNKDGNYNREDWVITIRFYSLVHFVEHRLSRNGYISESHHERLDNIRDCTAIDSIIYNRYRTLLDLSRDARYECKRMAETEVKESKKVLNDAKTELGFSMDGSGGNTKYST